MMLNTAAQERAKRLEKMARAAIKHYNDEMAKGGEPLFPDWALELVGLIADYDRMLATLNKRHLHMVNVVDFESGKCTASVIERVAS